MAVEKDGGRSPVTLVCEACGLQCKDPRDLAIHQERHRPVDLPTFDPDTGTAASYQCPEGCRRNFTTLARYRDHVPMCDGRSPLPPFIKSIATGYREGIVLCPECTEPFKDIDKLAFHLERHREVRPELRHRRTGDLLSKPCPKGCGRNFPHWKEYEEHQRLCEGQPPLPSKVDAEAALKKLNEQRLKRKKQVPGMMRCEECRRDFKKAGPFSIHLKKIHGRSYQPQAQQTTAEEEEQEEQEEESTAGHGSNGSMLSGLRDKSRDLRRKADRLDEIVNKIERLFKEADELL